MKRLFTSESVTEGHPDKVCDFIADSILDQALALDPDCRIACEVCASGGLIAVIGEFTTSGYVDIQKTAREAIAQVGYNKPEYGFDSKTCAVMTCIDEQSPDISLGVDCALEKRESKSFDELDVIGAGDQGMMYGYASNETSDFMPATIHYAHKLTKQLAVLRKNNELKYLRPDGKAQITLVYDNFKPVKVDTVVVSAQHDEDVPIEKLRKDILEYVIHSQIPKELLSNDTKFFINPTGRFVIGGPKGDTGVTGRKIIVDSYGGTIPHGGGAFSGKDPSKVDRSASYYARYVCKNIVAANLAERCMLTVSYAIGKARPVSIEIDTFNTAKFSEDKIKAAVNSVFDFRPLAIIKALNLKSPIYKMTTNYGHFGDKDLSYEKTDKVKDLLAAVKN